MKGFLHFHVFALLYLYIFICIHYRIIIFLFFDVFTLLHFFMFALLYIGVIMRLHGYTYYIRWRFGSVLCIVYIFKYSHFYTFTLWYVYIFKSRCICIFIFLHKNISVYSCVNDINIVSLPCNSLTIYGKSYFIFKF